MLFCRSRLHLLLQNADVGTYPDGVTKRKEPYLLITNTARLVSQLESQALSQTLTPWNPKTTRTGALALSISYQFEAMRALQAEGWIVEDYVPRSVWQALQTAMGQPSVSLDTIRRQITPAVFDRLQPFQRTAVQRAVSGRGLYIGDEMGCGKTFEALATCRYFLDLWPVLVVCPSSLRYNWQAEYHKFLGYDPDSAFVLKSTKHLTKVPADFRMFIVSYSLLIRPAVLDYVLQRRFQVVVLDECHYIKTSSMQTSQGLNYSQRTRATLRVCKQAEIRLLLSGTPFSYPVEMYSQLRALKPRLFPHFFVFSDRDRERIKAEHPSRVYYASRYCRPEKLPFQHGYYTQWKMKDYLRAPELYAVLQLVMIRRRKHHVLHLPNKNRICITLAPMLKKDEKKIKKLLDKDQNSRGFHFTEAVRETSRVKIPAVVEYVRTQLLTPMLEASPEEKRRQGKLLLFYNYNVMKDALEELLTKMNVSYFVINGETKGALRQEYTQSFQREDRYDVALLSITAAGTGLTLTAANTVVFTEIRYSAMTHTQAEDRAHRMGQARAVTVLYLLQPKSTDDINFGLTCSKERKSSTMLDGEENHMRSQRKRKHTLADAATNPTVAPTRRFQSRTKWCAANCGKKLK